MANYEVALQSVTYTNTSEDPDPATRTVTFTADDGRDTGSDSRDITVMVVNDAPVVTATAADLDYAAGASAVAVDPQLTVSDVDNTDLQGATVVISGGDTSEDVLSFVNQNGITGSFVGATLTLSGTAAVADYQVALRSVTYENTDIVDPNLATRTITFTVDDGQDTGADTRNVNVTNVAPINLVIDPPSGDPKGTVLHTGTNTLFVADDDTHHVFEFNLDGTLLSQFDTTTIDPSFDETEGIDFDPVTGHLFVASDSSGTQSVYMLTTSGSVISVTDMATATPGGFTDPEGIAYDAVSKTLYVAFDSNGQVAAFQLESNFQLTFLSAFSTATFGFASGSGPAGISFDPASGNLFLVSGKGPKSTVVEATTGGVLVRNFQVDLKSADGVDVLPNGNLLFSNARSGASGGGLFEFTQDGDPVSSPLMAAASSNTANSGGALTQSELRPLVAEAISRWETAGEDAERLADVQYRITDLPGNYLALASQDVVLIDNDAAGHGWFIDTTPADDLEFSLTQTTGELTALSGSPADGRIDLLSMVMHELGHLAGYEHSIAHDVMHATLPTGTRRLLDVDDHDDVPTIEPDAKDHWDRYAFYFGMLDDS